MSLSTQSLISIIRPFSSFLTKVTFFMKSQCRPFSTVIIKFVAFLYSSSFHDVTYLFMTLACCYRRWYHRRRTRPCLKWIRGSLLLLGGLLTRLWWIIFWVYSIATFILNTRPWLSYAGLEWQSISSSILITFVYMYPPLFVTTPTASNSTLTL